MAALREIFSRFRPAVPPGAAAGGGAPADRAAQHEAELEPVFASLSDAEEQAERLRRQAAREAAAIRAEGARDADAIIRVALERATSERETARQSALAGSDADCASMLKRSRARAHELRSRKPLVDEYVARIVAESSRQLPRSGSQEQR